MDECSLYSDPALYDVLFPSARAGDFGNDEARRFRLMASERFYLQEAKLRGGPVLELGCGSGRLTLPVAESGIEIIGADLSPKMLDAARAKALEAGLQIQWLEIDMRGFDLPRRFASVFIPGNSLLHLHTVGELKQCLACVTRHLAEGGRLVFDISKFDPGQLVQKVPARSPVFTLNDRVRGEIKIEETAHYDEANQIQHVDWYFSAPGAPDFRVMNYSLRVIFPQELLLLLESAGFRLDVRYGEFTREPFQASSRRQVCICSVRP